MELAEKLPPSHIPPHSEFPSNFGNCSGPQCPSSYIQPPSTCGTSSVTLFDQSINVFTELSFSALAGVAEFEGKLVSLGSFTVNNTDSNGRSAYYMGQVGAGSCVSVPPGDVAVRAQSGTIVGSTSAYLPNYGSRIEYTGSWVGSVVNGNATRNEGALDSYVGVPGLIQGISGCILRQAANGVVLNPDSATWILKCDGTASDPQYFVFDGNVGNPSGAQLATQDCNGVQTLVISVLGGPTRHAGSFSWGSISEYDYTKVLWNVVNASEILVSGYGQAVGSYLLPVYGSTARFLTPGVNGRVYSRGHVEHGPYLGSEMHAYPFRGVLPTCSGAGLCSSCAS